MWSEPNLTVTCEACGRKQRYGMDSLPVQVVCEGCMTRVSLATVDRRTGKGAVKTCFLCGSEQFVARRDFNLWAAVALLLLGGVIWLLFKEHTWAVVFPASAALLVAVVYWFSGYRTTCRACKAVYQGFPSNPDHRAGKQKNASQDSDDSGKSGDDTSVEA